MNDQMQTKRESSAFKKFLPYLLIIIVLLVAGGIYIDRTSVKGMPDLIKNDVSNQDQPSPASDNNKTSTTMKIDFKNYGPAPEFTGISGWLNSNALKISDLKGKVVLVDFWTYSCINCIRTLPYVIKWYDTYKDKGFLVIGVHTPEFPFEKVASNIQDAMGRFGIHYPVAQDNDYGTWNAYQNQYWPAEYLIDQKGNIVYTHFGEGNYDHTEDAIRQLLNIDRAVAPQNGQDLSKVNSPEMYFGTARLQYLSPEQNPSTQPSNFQLPKNLALNNFAMEGSWQFSPENAKLTLGNGKIKLHFSSGKLFMVAQSPTKPTVLKITVDGKAQPDVMVDKSELYTIFDSIDYRDHEVEINIEQPDFEAFTFTFG